LKDEEREEHGDSELSTIAFEEPSSMMDSVGVLRELLAVLELRATVRAHHILLFCLPQGPSSQHACNR
jgi:hypothetical protein